ncbi:aspartate aminotransferase family protein [bacterium]|nr:aspartate aminotransferase family protein [bacterium]
MDTISTEEKYFIPFFKKIPISIERGQGIYVWDENGEKYIDFTSGWGVTCLGHANPIIINAITEQSKKIIQNPSSGLTYSPARAKALSAISEILPGCLTRVFFSNSGAEANDAVIKLARKVTGRLNVISTINSFHGRTISTASATGQAKHRDKFNPNMPNYRFVPFNDIGALTKIMDENTAAVILEPIQGEGGVNISFGEYLKQVSDLCEKNGSYLIIDEVQTGFCRTGSMFAIDGMDIKVDFMTMAKGIAGGFPIGAFAVSEEIAEKIEIGDHGGTYCGNPLGCAVVHAVVRHLIDSDMSSNVKTIGSYTMKRLEKLKRKHPEKISDVRGKGLLIAIEFLEEKKAMEIYNGCIKNHLFVNITQGKIIRLFPALNITEAEMAEGLAIFEKVISDSN